MNLLAMIKCNMCHLFFIHIIHILLIDQIVTITPNTIYAIKPYLLKIIMGNQWPHIITRLDFDCSFYLICFDIYGTEHLVSCLWYIS